MLDSENCGLIEIGPIDGFIMGFIIGLGIAFLGRSSSEDSELSDAENEDSENEDSLVLDVSL
jgi:hypothetical protein